MAQLLTALFILAVSVFAGCDADLCPRRIYGMSYCDYGCCPDEYDGCCTNKIALIVGLSVGAAVLIIALIIVCICWRRRRFAGVVYRSQPDRAVIIHQDTTQSIMTGGVQPGVTYPAYPNNGYTPSQPYQPYPANPTSGYPPPTQMYSPPPYESLQPGPAQK